MAKRKDGMKTDEAVRLVPQVLDGNKKAPEVVSGASLVVRCEDGF